MSRINKRTIPRFLLLLFIFSNQACSAPSNQVDATQLPPAAETSVIVPTPFPSSTPTLTATPIVNPSASPTNIASPMPTLVDVSISAVNGNLFIRRGPDLAYNQVGALMRGETATVLARDVLAEWVEVMLPSKPDKTGWISVQTKYAVVHGNMMRLPARAITDWPAAAYIRNCTFHEMFILPEETIIPALSDSPDNEISLNPGIYKIYDSAVSGHPVVMEVNLSEGNTVDIVLNGNAEHHKCP